MNLKCIQKPSENQFQTHTNANGSQYHSIWEYNGLKIYVIAMAQLSLDIEYGWIGIDERILLKPSEVMRGKFKMDRGFLMASRAKLSSWEYFYHWKDQFTNSIATVEFAHLISKLASKYYKKEVKYGQQI